jgi:predicted dithiol-disulfide oxidoreductase (DUF899 family)
MIVNYQIEYLDNGERAMDGTAKSGTAHKVVGRDAWLKARKDLLAAEKEFTKLRDDLSRRRRELPWVRVDKDYVFEGSDGRETLAALFAGRSQLIVYHFMFGPDWEVGCKSCSFWADHFEGMLPHLAARDTSFAAISQGPLDKLQAQAKRLGWRFKWVSSLGGDFNFDYHVSFRPEALERGEGIYNYAPHGGTMTELPGISVFFKGADGSVFHTYSCYARGLDMMNGTYQYLDLTPKGRDEEGLPDTMTWVRLHDEYPA